MFFADIWTPANKTMCYDNMVCEEECCHDLEFGIPYCCSKYTGLIYLELMIGGSVIIAILVIACCVFMKRTERELEAAAKLEAAKAANNAHSTSSLDTSSTDLNNLANLQPQDPDVNRQPPTYHDVMRTFTRCHSCDITMATSAQSVEIMNALVRQYSEGNQSPLRGLPVLVDVQELISRHRREQSGHNMAVEAGLPPVNSQEALENKLPTYEECTRGNMEVACGHRECSRTSREVACGHRECSRENLTGIGDSKSHCQVVSGYGSSYDYGCHDGTRRDVEQGNKMLGESNVYFENVSETILNVIREGSVRSGLVCSQVREGSEGEENDELTVNTGTAEWVQEEHQVMEDTTRGQWVQEVEHQVIVDTSRGQWVQEVEHQVIIETDRRERAKEETPPMIINTDTREWVQEDETQTIVDTDRTEWVQEDETQTIVDTDRTEWVQETESREMKAKAETRKCVLENGTINGTLNAEAGDLTENLEAVKIIANTNITSGYWINRAAHMKANERTGNREIEEEIEVSGIGEEAENKEGRIRGRDSQTSTEAVEAGMGIEGNSLGGYVGENMKLADGGIRTEILANVREEYQHTETRENREDVKIKEGITGTEKREGIGDTGTIQEPRRVNTGAREEVVSVDTKDDVKDEEPRDTASSIQTGSELADTEIKGAVNSNTIQDKELTKWTAGTRGRELTNEAELKRKQLGTKITQEILNSKSEENIELT